MGNVSVKILGVDGFVKEQIQLIKNISNLHLQDIAHQSEKRIQFHVLASVQRPGSTGKLAESIFAEKTSNGWGLGKISYLNKVVPYWRWINFGVAGTGRKIPPATYGVFNPGSQPPQGPGPNRSGRFQPLRSTEGGFKMVPTLPIQPHNYIQRTLQQQNSIISSVLRSRNKLK